MKQKPFREKVVLFARKAGGWCFLIAMVSGLLSLAVPPVAVLFPVFFTLAFVSFGTMFLPGAFAPFYWPQFALFLCLTGAGISMTMMFTGMAMKIPMKSDFMQGAGYLFMFAVLSGFAGMIGSGGSAPATKKELMEALESAAKKLGLTVKDNHPKYAIHLVAEGKDLVLDLHRTRNTKAAPTSSVTFTPHIPPVPVKILCTQGIVDITCDDSLRKEKLESFIAKKDLNEYDFSLNATGKNVAVQVAVAIEEDELWVDFAELCRMAGS
ncbi:MAG: hypothetical protein ACAH80_02975 [Alphaproteobacteria bacterium]